MLLILPCLLATMFIIRILFTQPNDVTSQASPEEQWEQKLLRRAKSWSFPEDCYRLVSNKSELQLPLDAEEHYQELLVSTAHFRDLPLRPSHSSQSDPVIENHWISTFCCEEPRGRFGPYIPLFIQWSDIETSRKSWWLVPKLAQFLTSNLRRNVPYITVSQSPHGLLNFTRNLSNFPNLLILSAGGVGDAALPLYPHALVMDPVRRLPNAELLYDIAFVGSMESKLSRCLQHLVTTSSTNLSSYFGPANKARKIMKVSRFILVLPGMGRSSYRIAETIQMGLLPIFVYTDSPWLPYTGWASFEKFGFAVKGQSGFSRLLPVLANMSQQEYSFRRAQVLKVKELYTFAGVMKQIRKFLRSGYRESLLRCSDRLLSPTLPSLDPSSSLHRAIRPVANVFLQPKAFLQPIEPPGEAVTSGTPQDCT
eukprot:gb/GEZN01006200.1/.p1 GENE.gb/GEZN01006200.1/~~gb/GEZN01006200.1/.p1  ORF type:complete len:424 (+),score=35.98 gb/GEZN01006200.1/:100-1371(+)